MEKSTRMPPCGTSTASDAGRAAHDTPHDVSPAAGGAIASLERVTLAYESDTVALSDVSLELRRGERVCVLGPNGSGKSTLASVLCGLLAPDEGTVRLLGHAVCTDGTADLEAYRGARRGLGLVFQDPQDQIVTSVVDEDVAFGPENIGLHPDEIGRRVERELDRVAMSEYAHADPSRLSGGQCQRVAIASALAMEPDLLVLDEPGALLDARGRRAILRVISRLRDEGVTIVHVTHFMEEALDADRVIVLDKGRVTLDGTPDEAFSAPERLRVVGLEEPFCGTVSARLRGRGMSVGWTCREGDLLASLAALAPPAGEGEPGREAEGSEDGTGTAGLGAEFGASAEPEANAAVEAEHVSFSHAGRGAGGALDDVCLRIPAGATCSIVGHTGSGKSTLLRLLAALERPDSGHVRVGGVDTSRRRGRRLLRGRVGLVMQRPERQLFAESVLADVAYGPRNLGAGEGEARERAREALGLVGLAERGDDSPFSLSGGQRRLCAIAGILAMRPELLLLDEPMAGLDPSARAELRRVLGRLRDRGTTVVQVTHSMDEAARSDMVAVMDHARVALVGAPADVFRPDNADELRRIGVGRPRPAELADGLRRRGVPVPGNPLTADDLVDGICRALSDGPSPSGRDEGVTRLWRFAWAWDSTCTGTPSCTGSTPGPRSRAPWP